MYSWLCEVWIDLRHLYSSSNLNNYPDNIWIFLETWACSSIGYFFLFENNLLSWKIPYNLLEAAYLVCGLGAMAFLYSVVYNLLCCYPLLYSTQNNFAVWSLDSPQVTYIGLLKFTVERNKLTVSVKERELMLTTWGRGRNQAGSWLGLYSLMSKQHSL